MTRELRGGYLGNLITLVVQFLLGMVTNLFVDIPKNHPGANPPEYFSGVASNVVWAIVHGPSLWLTLHAILGLFLVVFGFRVMLVAIRSRQRSMIIVAVTGALAILGAGIQRRQLSQLPRGLQLDDHGQLFRHRRHGVCRRAVSTSGPVVITCAPPARS